MLSISSLLLSTLSLFYSFDSFSHQRLLMVFHWSLRDSKFPQVSRTLLSILDDLNNVVVRMVFTHPLIFTSSSPSIDPLVTVPRAPLTIGITVTFMFNSFFSSLARSTYLSLSDFLQFYPVVRISSQFGRFSIIIIIISSSSSSCCCTMMLWRSSHANILTEPKWIPYIKKKYINLEIFLRQNSLMKKAEIFSTRQ